MFIESPLFSTHLAHQWDAFVHTHTHNIHEYITLDIVSLRCSWLWAGIVVLCVHDMYGIMACISIRVHLNKHRRRATETATWIDHHRHMRSFWLECVHNACCWKLEKEKTTHIFINVSNDVQHVIPNTSLRWGCRSSLCERALDDFFRKSHTHNQFDWRYVSRWSTIGWLMVEFSINYLSGLRIDDDAI